MKYISVICMTIIVMSCVAKKEYKEISDCLDQDLNVDMIDSVRYKDKLYEFKKIKDDYSYFYIVYLKMGCISCYKKFYDWQNAMHSVHKSKRTTVLFVIRGNSYKEFIEQVKVEGLKEDNYFTFLDPNDSYKKGNEYISTDIIEEPILINNKNKVKLIGNPFLIPEMSDLFKSIIKE